MSRTRPLTPRRVFFAARRVPRTRRDAFVEQVCRENDDLRRQVKELLVAADRPGAFTGPPTAAKRLLDRLAATDPARGGTSPPRDRGPILTAGARLADRYVIESLVGEGSSGRVYRATDEVLRTTVAVKVLDLEAGEELRQLRREAATLRWLRVPGVVNLQDDGVDGGRPYIVTDLVVGAPFPGSPAAPTWASIRDAAVALLETLARIHAQGVIHGDLKPSNVLVDAHGIPTVLDVGIASGPSIEFGAGEDDDFVAGTPSYMAPERIGGAPASVATDLYAVGVMLHEALCGQVPHHATSRTGLFDRRRLEEARPLRELAPDAPPDAARMIDALLARDATRRPASAYDALDRLAHRRHVRPGSPDFPWLGSRALIDRLVEAAREGRSLDVWGPPGAGKTRTLREAARAVEAQGKTVLWLASATTPFESLSRALAPLDASTAPSPDVAARELDERLTAVLASGVIVVADGVETLDSSSVAALRTNRPAGTVWSASRHGTGESQELPRLTEGDLERLFAGHNTLFHTREDAARELRARTAGLPGASLDEAASWVRAGLATFEGDRIRLSRHALSRLERQRLEPRPSTDAERGGPARDARRLSGTRDGDDARDPTLGRALGFLGAGRDVEFALEVDAWAREQARRRRGTVALQLVVDALRAAPTSDDGLEVRFLPSALVAAALASGSRGELEVARHAADALAAADRRLGLAGDILRAALRAIDGRPAEAIASLDAIVERTPDDLRRHLESVRIFAARSLPLDVEEAAVRRAAEWASRTAPGDAPAPVAEWQAWLRYRQGRFRDAAQLQRAHAMAQHPDSPTHAAALLASASALMEDDDLAGAAATLADARPACERARNPLLESRCAWLERCVAYRRDPAPAVDEALARAVRDLGHAVTEARILLTEAAIAWRGGQRDRAARLAIDALAASRRGGHAPTHGLCLALALHLRALEASDEARALLSPSQGLEPPAVDVQVLALAAPAATEGDDAELRRRFDAALARIPDVDRRRRRELLSVEEAILLFAATRDGRSGRDAVREVPPTTTIEDR